jgi:hypothetical protein
VRGAYAPEGSCLLGASEAHDPAQVRACTCLALDAATQMCAWPVPRAAARHPAEALAEASAPRPRAAGCRVEAAQADCCRSQPAAACLCAGRSRCRHHHRHRCWHQRVSPARSCTRMTPLWTPLRPAPRAPCCCLPWAPLQCPASTRMREGTLQSRHACSTCMHACICTACPNAAPAVLVGVHASHAVQLLQGRKQCACPKTPSLPCMLSCTAHASNKPTSGRDSLPQLRRVARVSSSTATGS